MSGGTIFIHGNMRLNRFGIQPQPNLYKIKLDAWAMRLFHNLNQKNVLPFSQSHTF